MLGAHGVGLREGGDRARDPADARVPAPGEVEAIGGAAQECVRLRFAWRQPRREQLPCRDDARANYFRGLARSRDDEVEAVEECARELVAIGS